MRRLSIGQFSQATRLSIKALRLYADNGVLPPVHVDATTGYRFYDAAQMERAERVKTLRGVGMSLNVIQQVLDAPTTDAQLLLLDQHAAHLTRQLDQLARFRTQWSAPRNSESTHGVEVYTVPAQCIAGVRIKTNLTGISADIRNAFEILHRGLSESPLQTTGTPMIIYHDLIDEVSDGDVEVGVPVHQSASRHPTLILHNLESVTVAAIVHRGSYDQIATAYQRLLQVISSQGLEPVGSPREIYLNDPATTSPDAWLTRIEFPVANFIPSP